MADKWWEQADKFSYGQNAACDKHLDWLYKGREMCKCAFAYGPLGRLDGVDMGNTWLRVTTHPYCAEHGTKAEKERKERLRQRRVRK